MKNQEIAQIFYNIADILELQEVKWTPQAYRKAAQEIESLSEDIKDIYERGELEDLPGIGEHLAAKIEEIIKTGKLRYYEDLKKEVKIDIESLNEIPSLGPKKIKILYKKLGIKNIEDLEKACEKHLIQKLAGFGEKTEDLILKGIQLKKSHPHRFLYFQALPIVNELMRHLKRSPYLQKVEVAGSFRRGKETVGDIDLLAISNNSEKIIFHFISFPDVKEVLAQGPTKCSVRLNNLLQVDLRVLREKEFGSAMNYFIGSKEHNVELRKFALSKGYTLSEYGLFALKGKKWVAGRTEEEIYRKLGLRYIEPELRENKGEIEAALNGNLPKLITTKDINGVFHLHTKWSDGENTLEEMARKAEELKLKFISFNDHYSTVGITNPLNEKRLKSYLAEIEKVRKKIGIKIFSGVEIDILKDGTLPLSNKMLKELDVVIASVHLATKMPEKGMTKRVCKALENYHLNILGHSNDRLLNQREPISLNLEKVFQTAKDNRVLLEINSSPQRMDLPGEQVKSALDLGCKFAISVDAHSTSHLPFYNLGVLMARRGWVEKKDILNCWSMPKIEKALRK